MKQHVSIITLGVRDLGRAKRFYSERLGWTVTAEEGDWVAFGFGDGSSALSLYPWEGLAEDPHVASEGTGFRGVTLAYGVGSEERVDEVLAEVAHAGGSVVKPAEAAAWGGYNGYFSDRDGHLWEVVTLGNFRAEERLRGCRVVPVEIEYGRTFASKTGRECAEGRERAALTQSGGAVD